MGDKNWIPAVGERVRHPVVGVCEVDAVDVTAGHVRMTHHNGQSYAAMLQELERWVPKIGEWVRHRCGVVGQIGELRPGDPDVSLRMLDGHVARALIEEMEPWQPRAGERVWVTDWTDSVWMECLWGEWPDPRPDRRISPVDPRQGKATWPQQLGDLAAYRGVAPTSSQEPAKAAAVSACSHCGGDTYAGLHGREHACPLEEPKLEKVLWGLPCGSEVVCKVTGRGQEAVHPLEATALEMWWAKVKR